MEEACGKKPAAATRERCAMDGRKAKTRCAKCGAEFECDPTPFLDADGQEIPQGHYCRACVLKSVERGRRVVREMLTNPDNEYAKKWAGTGVVEVVKALFGPAVRN